MDGFPSPGEDDVVMNLECECACVRVCVYERERKSLVKMSYFKAMRVVIFSPCLITLNCTATASDTSLFISQK